MPANDPPPTDCSAFSRSRVSTRKLGGNRRSTCTPHSSNSTDISINTGVPTCVAISAVNFEPNIPPSVPPTPMKPYSRFP